MFDLPRFDFSFRLGPFEWEVIYSDDVSSQKGVFGTCDPNVQKIYIQKGPAGGLDIKHQKKEHTFWHELMHAIYWTYGLCDITNPTEEQTVSAMSMGLTDFTNQNPALFEKPKIKTRA